MMLRRNPAKDKSKKRYAYSLDELTVYFPAKLLEDCFKGEVPLEIDPVVGHYILWMADNVRKSQKK